MELLCKHIPSWFNHHRSMWEIMDMLYIHHQHQGLELQVDKSNWSSRTNNTTSAGRTSSKRGSFHST
eukprot:11387375-Prorocentrum_lima.AAC.1